MYSSTTTTFVQIYGLPILRFEQYLGGAIAKRTLQLKHHQPVTINA